MSLISQTETYTKAGTYTYTVPPGVSTVEFHLWGAGGATGSSGPIKDVEVGSIPQTVSTGLTQVQTGTNRVQTGTRQVQTGTRQIQVGTTQVQVGTRQEAYAVAVPNVGGKGVSVKNNGKRTSVRTETRFRTVPVFETRPVFRTVPVYGTEPVYRFDPVFGLQPVFSTIEIPTFESRSGGNGGSGAGGGYSYKKIQVSQGDLIVVYVGSAGVRNIGGISLTTPVNYSGGNAGSASNGGVGGGGGGATVFTLNGTVIAVAAGGGGGGGGGILGRSGDPGSPAVISGIGSGVVGRGGISNAGPATGGGGGGGFYGGSAGSSGATGGAGFGGVSFGTVIQSGSGIIPGGRTVSAYPGRNAGFATFSGAAVLTFTKSFNINVKQTNNWKFIDNAWVKVDGEWKDILNGWVKVDGVWEPLITARSIEGAENLANPIITYALSANRSNVAEGEAVSFTISTTGLNSGNLVPYSVTGIQASDLQVGSLSGNFAVDTGSTITFVPRANNTTNGLRDLRVILDNTGISSSCTILDTSLSPVYTVAANVSTINEGQAVSFVLGNTFGVIGESVNYNITGIASSRIASGSLTGAFVVGSSEQTVIAVNEDRITTGNTIMTMNLVGKSASTAVTVVDTSLTPAGSVAFESSGNWTVPAGVFKITVLVTGGGGGGAGGHGTGCGNTNHIGGNGGSSESLQIIRDVTPGSVISFTVGAGGAGGPGFGVGGNGSSTVILGVTARGGGGGINGTSKGPGAAGTSYSSPSISGIKMTLRQRRLNAGGGGIGGAYRSAGNAGEGGSILISWGSQ
jgi:hypothetical protein